MSRGFKISRQECYEIQPKTRVDWLNEFVKNIEKADNNSKTAVEAARERDKNQNLLDQIVSIVSGKPVLNRNTVDSKVQELQERTGLKEYLKRQAQIEANELPDFLKKKLSNDTIQRLTDYIRNHVDSLKGNFKVPP